MTEIATILGQNSYFAGDEDPRAPHVRALSWILEQAGVYDLTTGPDDRVFVTIDLPGAYARITVTRTGEDDNILTRKIEGAALGEVLEAGAALAALYPDGELPDIIDLDGKLRQLVTFHTGRGHDDLLTAWTKLRDRRKPDARHHQK